MTDLTTYISLPDVYGLRTVIVGDRATSCPTLASAMAAARAGLRGENMLEARDAAYGGRRQLPHDDICR